MDGVYDYLVEPALHKFASFTFEDVCKEFVKELQKKNALPFRYSKMGRWMGKTTIRTPKAESGITVGETEIDLLAISRNADAYLVGECKFKKNPFTYAEYQDTLAKLGPEQEKAKFYYALFSESGFDAKIAEAATKGDTLRLYDLDEIVNLR